MTGITQNNTDTLILTRLATGKALDLSELELRVYEYPEWSQFKNSLSLYLCELRKCLEVNERQALIRRIKHDLF